jgi:hypothetical protein
VTAPQDDASRWLLWTTGLAALVLGIVAFLLWGTSSAGYLLDLAAAYCGF